MVEKININCKKLNTNLGIFVGINLLKELWEENFNSAQSKYINKKLKQIWIHKLQC